MKDLLASVALVSQSLPPLPHVAALIQAHLDHSHLWTLETASRAGFVHLLDRLTARKKKTELVCSEFRLARFTSAVQKAAAQGRVAVLQWWSSKYLLGQDLSPLVLGIAAESGQLGVIQWLFGQENPAEQSNISPVLCNDRETLFWLYDHAPWLPLMVSMDTMAEQRDLELMQWAHERRNAISIECALGALATAAEIGHLEMLQWLHSHYGHVGCSELALSHATGNGHLEIVEWLYDQYSEVMTFTEPDVTAVRRGYDTVVKWIIERFQWRDDAARASWASWAIVLSCRLEMVRYLLPYCDVESRSDMLRTTIYWGRLDIVQWLHEQQVEWFAGAIEAAAESGRLEILQWLHDNRNDECSTYAMYGAATNNQVSVMRWLHENRTEGCTTAAMDTAAANGHLEMIQWLHENRSEGCTTYAMDSAVRGHYLDVVQWLHVHRHEGCTTRAMDAAARSGDFDMLQWLHENRTEGCTVKAMDLAAANGHLQIVQWLHANRSEGCSLSAVDSAAARGHLEVVQFLMLECKLQCSLSAIDEAFKRGHFHIVEWLMHHDPDRFLDMSKWRMSCNIRAHLHAFGRNVVALGSNFVTQVLQCEITKSRVVTAWTLISTRYPAVPLSLASVVFILDLMWSLATYSYPNIRPPNLIGKENAIASRSMETSTFNVEQDLSKGGFIEILKYGYLRSCLSKCIAVKIESEDQYFNFLISLSEYSFSAFTLNARHTDDKILRMVSPSNDGSFNNLFHYDYSNDVDYASIYQHLSNPIIKGPTYDNYCAAHKQGCEAVCLDCLERYRIVTRNLIAIMKTFRKDLCSIYFIDILYELIRFENRDVYAFITYAINNFSDGSSIKIFATSFGRKKVKKLLKKLNRPFRRIDYKLVLKKYIPLIYKIFAYCSNAAVDCLDKVYDFMLHQGLSMFKHVPSENVVVGYMVGPEYRLDILYTNAVLDFDKDRRFQIGTHPLLEGINFGFYKEREKAYAEVNSCDRAVKDKLKRVFENLIFSGRSVFTNQIIESRDCIVIGFLKHSENTFQNFRLDIHIDSIITNTKSIDRLRFIKHDKWRFEDNVSDVFYH